MLYLTAFSVVKNETDAEECAQDAVVNAYRNLAKFRGDSKFSTWLVTIVVNEARQKLRKTKRAKEESLDEAMEGEEGEYTPMPLTDWRQVPSKAVARKKLGKGVKKAKAEWQHTFLMVI